MNFFGHAAVAARRGGSQSLVLGAMLPDLTSMARIRVPAVGEDELARGVELHHETDAAFHRHARFRALCAWALDELTSAGLSRGSARAVGHVGCELLLDGVLCDDAHSLDVYRRALAFGVDLVVTPAFRFATPRDAAALRAVLGRLLDAPLPAGYRDPAFVAERLAAILSRRPRLALQPADGDAVERWLRRARPAVARDLGGVVDALASE